MNIPEYTPLMLSILLTTFLIHENSQIRKDLQKVDAKLEILRSEYMLKSNRDDHYYRGYKKDPEDLR